MLDVEPEHTFLNKTTIAKSVYLNFKLDYSHRFYVPYDWVLFIAKMLKVKTEYNSLNGTMSAMSAFG